MTIVRTVTLRVSLSVRLEGKPVRYTELCAGVPLEVTDKEEPSERFSGVDETLCILRDGREVWIERRWL